MTGETGMERFEGEGSGSLNRVKSGYALEAAGERTFNHFAYVYDPGSLDMPKRMPVPEVSQPSRLQRLWRRNSDTYHPIWARPDARVPGVTGRYPNFNKR
jgi:hypothetical protein